MYILAPFGYERTYLRMYDAIYQFLLTSPIDKWLTQKEVHRQPNHISDKEKVSTLCINSTAAVTTFIRFTQVN